MRAWLVFPLLGIISPITEALGRISVLGSELEDSHFRKKKPKSKALYPLPMVRPMKGTRVISPQPAELLWSGGRKQEEEEALHPTTFGKRVQGCRKGRGVVVCSWSSSSIHCVCWLRDARMKRI